MSFVKHAIFTGSDAPKLTDYKNIARHILDRVSPDRVLISEGVVDHLDHASPKQFEGGKLGVDATAQVVEEGVEEMLGDKELLKMLQNIDEDIVDIRQYEKDSKNPVVVAAYRKRKSVQNLFDKLEPLKKHMKIFVAVNEFDDLDNPYMLIWRVTNNIDAKRDVRLEPFIMIDGTNKDPKIDDFPREWPPDVVCSKEVIEDLQKRGFIDVDEEFLRRYGVV